MYTVHDEPRLYPEVGRAQEGGHTGDAAAQGILVTGATYSACHPWHAVVRAHDRGLSLPPLPCRCCLS